MSKEEIIEAVKGMTVLELNELVKAIEEEFGVTAAAPQMVVQGEAGGEAEKTEFDVVLTDVGGSKLQVVKAVRNATGLNIKEAKALVDGAPATLKEGVAKEEAEKIKEEIEATGATVELK